MDNTQNINYNINFGARYVVRFPKGTLSDFPVKSIKNKAEGWRAIVLDEPYFPLSNHDSDELFIRDNIAPYEFGQIERQLTGKIIPAFLNEYFKLSIPKIETRVEIERKQKEAEHLKAERLKSLEERRITLTKELELAKSINREAAKAELLHQFLITFNAEVVPEDFRGGRYPNGYTHIMFDGKLTEIRKVSGGTWRNGELMKLTNAVSRQFSNIDSKLNELDNKLKSTLRKDIAVKEKELSLIIMELNQLTKPVEIGHSDSDDKNALLKEKTLTEQAKSQNRQEKQKALNELASNALDGLDTFELVEKNPIF